MSRNKLDVFGDEFRARREKEVVERVEPAGPDADGLWLWRAESTFHFVLEYGPYMNPWRFKLPAPGEIWVDCLPPPGEKPQGMRVLFLAEPNVVSGLRWQAIKQRRRFDCILTFDRWVRALCRNAELFPYGTAWVQGEPKVKEFGVSTVIGYKRQTRLHRMRRRLWNYRDQIQVPVRMYASGNRANLDFDDDYPWILGGDKLPMFETQFHIAIENAVQRDFFTEKIIDCFLTDTVPFYVGCPNIGRYFNQKGIIHVRSLKDVVKAANSVTPELYESMRPAMEDNRERAGQWINLEGRLQATLERLVGKRKLAASA